MMMDKIIAQEKQNVITWTQYKTLAARAHVVVEDSDEKEIETMTSFLSGVGSLLWFNKPNLKNYVILGKLRGEGARPCFTSNLSAFFLIIILQFFENIGVFYSTFSTDIRRMLCFLRRCNFPNFRRCLRVKLAGISRLFFFFVKLSFNSSLQIRAG